MVRTFALFMAVLAPAAVLAAGGHDKIGCSGCHSMHAVKGDQLSAVAPNKKMVDYKTGQPHQPITALCISCHGPTEEGGKGIASVANHLGHPFSRATVNPRLARVPASLLRDGHFECVSCHDPHPSNPNYRYLRVKASNQAPSMTVFCGICHPRKADPNAIPQSLFSSMDETAGKARALEAEE